MKKFNLWFFAIVIFAMMMVPMTQQQSCSVPPYFSVPEVPSEWDWVDMTGQKWKNVIVCQDSLLLPREICPETCVWWFKYPEDFPIGLCNIHKPEIPQLTYSVERLWQEFDRPIYLTTWLMPSLLINKQASWEGYKAFIDILVENDYGNSYRAFAAGVWEQHTIDMVRFPFVKVKVDGKWKFDLEQMNPEWLEETLRRIKYFVERGGTIIYTLIDGCSLPPYRNGWWNFHWWNGDNNINGTCSDVKAMGHLYNWATRPIPGAKETKYYVLKFMRDMVRKLEKEFPGSIVYDFNEFNADTEFYLNVDRDVFQKFDIPKHRKMFSMTNTHFSNFPWGDIAEIMLKYIWQPHGICSLDAYNNMYWPGPGLIQPSADGCAPPASREQAKFIVFNSFMDGMIGFENNRYHKDDWVENEENYWRQADWNIAEGMKEGFLMWYEVNR